MATYQCPKCDNRKSETLFCSKHGAMLCVEEVENQELKSLLNQCRKSMSWMIETMKFKHDEATGHDPDTGLGGYSPELKAAMELMEKVKGIV